MRVWESGSIFFLIAGDAADRWHRTQVPKGYEARGPLLYSHDQGICLPVNDFERSTTITALLPPIIYSTRLPDTAPLAMLIAAFIAYTTQSNAEKQTSQAVLQSLSALRPAHTIRVYIAAAISRAGKPEERNAFAGCVRSGTYERAHACLRCVGYQRRAIPWSYLSAPEGFHISGSEVLRESRGPLHWRYVWGGAP